MAKLTKQQVEDLKDILSKVALAHDQIAFVGADDTYKAEVNLGSAMAMFNRFLRYN